MLTLELLAPRILLDSNDIICVCITTVGSRGLGGYSVVVVVVRPGSAHTSDRTDGA